MNLVDSLFIEQIFIINAVPCKVLDHENSNVCEESSNSEIQNNFLIEQKNVLYAINALSQV